MREYLSGKGLFFPLLALLVLLTVVGGWLGATRTIACAVYVNGKLVCVARDEAPVKREINKICEAGKRELGHQVSIQSQVEYKTVLVPRESVVKDSQIPEFLARRMNLKTTGFAIVVNGKTVVTVGSRDIARQVLDDLKAKYSSCKPEEKLVSIAFAEKVRVKETEVPLSQVVSRDKALSILETGTDTPLIYEVKEGDSLWLIARRHNMHVVDIKAANRLEGERLEPGQKLTLYATEPFINVLTTVQGNRTEKIPYHTRVITDRSKSSVIVKQEGKEGEKRVTYRATRKNGSTVEVETIAEKIVEQAVDRVIVKGQRVRIASSRGGGGSGILSWPLFGHINSYFGSRGGSHKGVDIDGKTGDPIRAADSGRVVFAGRSGGYGLMVEINHGNGVITRYAHCSKLLVGVGERVSKGEVIARVGSTGRSTGPHLHFEVISQGAQRNPLKYLR
ncbi:MAG: M23 family metallopeptidase [Syntrophomonadaceae bacterium]|nr:M23 family metallopeptidase [Syntrophomonadaceae bacterium]